MGINWYYNLEIKFINTKNRTAINEYLKNDTNYEEFVSSVPIPDAGGYVNVGKYVTEHIESLQYGYKVKPDPDTGTHFY